MNSHKDRELNSFLNTYNRLDVIIERGAGCYLYTSDGRKILDMFAGLAVNVLGYNHRDVTNAIKIQIEKYTHISNYFYQEPQINFAEKLLKISKYSKLFLCNSGTEAAEAAIKLIRKYYYKTAKTNLISFSGSFHGRTIGALSLTQRKKYRDYFEPLLKGTIGSEYNSLIELETVINEKTAAVFIEFIQGEGGVVIAQNNFIDKLSKLRDKYNFLIVADEIQTGLGRTGKFFAFENYNVEPDIILMAKGIGGGLPLGVILVNSNLKNVFEQGDHGSTFGGNPVACSAGIEVLDKINNKFLSDVKHKGEYLINKLHNLKIKYSGLIKDIRGKGLMIGIEMYESCQKYVDEMLEMDILINCTNSNVIRLLPPLIITIDEIDFFISGFDKLLSNKQKNPV